MLIACDLAHADQANRNLLWHVLASLIFHAASCHASATRIQPFIITIE